MISLVITHYIEEIKEMKKKSFKQRTVTLELIKQQRRLQLVLINNIVYKVHEEFADI